MRFLYEEFDNKGPTTSSLMRLDCLSVYVCMCVHRSAGFCHSVLLTYIKLEKGIK